MKITEALRRYPVLYLFCACLFLFSCSEKKPSSVLDNIPDPKTLGESYVSNPDQVLSEATVSDLNSRLSLLDQAGVIHIDVAVVKSIGELVPKETAHELFRKWKIGDAEKDNGLLILLVLDQRRVEFETGYGIEGVLPDVICKRIQQRVMLPFLKQSNYDEAVSRGVEAVIGQVEKDNRQAAAADSSAADTNALAPVPPAGYMMPEQPATEAIQADPVQITEESSRTSFLEQETGFGTLVVCSICYLVLAATTLYHIGRNNPKIAGLVKALIFVPLLLLPVLVSFGFVSWSIWQTVLSYYLVLVIYIHVYCLVVLAGLRRWPERHARYLYLDRKLHGLEWTAYVFPFPLLFIFWVFFRRKLHHYRYDAYTCGTCGKAMQRLEETADDQFLTAAQQKEESLRSVDYDVWQCVPCQQQLILSYENLESALKTCPSCSTKALQFKSRKTVKRATKKAEGWGLATYACSHCQATQEEKFTIARIPESSGNSSSSFSSSSSSSSGSSSSSSSSSGGSSGGGGAGSSW
ncbi:hypothetical protein C7T94_07430 [Pedobacter yulinensis]|uniref:TPM domain-containing protein n=1 Tax=Pedobacter yulinensis TaxID=2126353 RepID=A0A2T3HJE3_9SPHI|nr:TPM domain-containing protein [Pedobacter yulinensis]PST82501.1 hypothetical protein C7T94_07430 [Pedobacter yulinensis]